ncbi:MAG: hypothetical protein IPG89_21555 [Bacteroidetes bacterium]|nr:hypothetical protein [Bacteroidota bacterium]
MCVCKMNGSYTSASLFEAANNDTQQDNTTIVQRANTFVSCLMFFMLFSFDANIVL